ITTPSTKPTLVPYTTLFRSGQDEVGRGADRPEQAQRRAVGAAQGGGGVGQAGQEPGGPPRGRAGPPDQEAARGGAGDRQADRGADRKSTRLNSSHQIISYAV